jgi:hypothetical protein
LINKQASHVKAGGLIDVGYLLYLSHLYCPKAIRIMTLIANCVNILIKKRL